MVERGGMIYLDFLWKYFIGAMWFTGIVATLAVCELTK